MPIISVRDNENNRWKRNAKKPSENNNNNNKKQNQNETKQIKTEKHKGNRSYSKREGWELNDWWERKGGS